MLGHLWKVGEAVSGDGGSGDHTADGDHGETAVLELLELHLLLLLGVAGVEAKGVEGVVTGAAVVALGHAGVGGEGHGLDEGDPEEDLLHGVREGIVGVDDLGDGFEAELLSGDADELRDDEADGGEHGGAAVLELGLAEPGEPLGGALGEAAGVEVDGGPGAAGEGHWLGTLAANHAVGELLEGRGGGALLSGGEGGGRGHERGKDELHFGRTRWGCQQQGDMICWSWRQSESGGKAKKHLQKAHVAVFSRSCRIWTSIWTCFIFCDP